jgi:Curlin associated repeat
MTKPLTTAFMAALVGSLVLTGGLASEAQAKRSRANVHVFGNNSDVQVKQKGDDNEAHGMVFGDNHDVSVEQRGNGNTSGVLAVGKGAKIKRKQQGDGRLDIDIAVGFDD